MWDVARLGCGSRRRRAAARCSTCRWLDVRGNTPSKPHSSLLDRDWPAFSY